VHIEFVYGRVSILPKHRMSIGGATAGLLVITLAMLALAYIRTHAKSWRKNVGPGGPADTSPPVLLAGGRVRG
jgi:hypothetical protein